MKQGIYTYKSYSAKNGNTSFIEGYVIFNKPWNVSWAEILKLSLANLTKDSKFNYFQKPYITFFSKL